MQYDEPGPSNTQRSPSLVLPSSPTVAHHNHAGPYRAPPAPTQDTMVMSTQATLIATQPQPITRPAQTQTQTKANPPQNLSNTTAVRQEQPVPSTGGGRAARKTVPKRVPNTAAVVPSAPVQMEQRPLRITRARSRSVDPNVASKAKDKGKGKGKQIPALRPVFEDPAVGRDEGISQSGLTGETYEEEDAVDHLLIEASMEPEDDAQIRRVLENPDQLGKEETEEDEDDEDEDELDRLVKARAAKEKATSRSKPAVSANPLRPGTNINRSTGSSTGNPLTNTHTPITGQSTRTATAAVEMALESNFPSPGSRARAVREKMERESRKAQYEPPEGTRAHKARLLR